MGSTTRGTPIARAGNSFSDQAERTLRDQILHGRRQAGDRLNEVEIASELGVSRGPVREAMQRLARDGLVELQAHRGAFVRRLGPDEVRSLFEARMALESQVARLAAERADAGQRERLQLLKTEALSAIDAGDAGGLRAADGRVHADERFLGARDLHALLAEASRSPALAAHAASVNQELRLLRMQSGETPSRALEATREHAAVIEAVLEGNGPRAAAAMSAHLREALEYALGGIEPAG